MSELQTQIKMEEEDDDDEEEMSELPNPIEWVEEMSDLQAPLKSEGEEEEEMSESEESTSTPPELLELLPAKSRVRYERYYQTFVKWCNEKKFTNYTEDVLLAYFRELVSQNRKALWALYSMLKACILIHKNIDISKYSKLMAYLKLKTANVKSKKSRALAEDQINFFIEQADDKVFLLMKVALIIGVTGALRREELYNLVVKDLELKADIIVITVPEAKTNRCRQFVVMNTKWVSLVQKYLQIRLKAPKTKDRLFLKYEQGRCVNAPVGINTIGKIPSKIAKFLNLNNCEEYTGHCFRRSSTALQINRSGQLPTLNNVPGDSNSDKVSAAEGYAENSLKRKIEDAEMITEPEKPSTSNKNPNTENKTSTQIIIESSSTEEANKLISGLFARVQNCNIVVNIYNNCNISKE